MASEAQDFQYVVTDVSEALPADWRSQLAEVARDADFRHYPRTPIISREAPEVLTIHRGRVRADAVQERLPWLSGLYREEFLLAAQKFHRERIGTAQDSRYGIVLNVQRDIDMRFECHVDSNPLTGVLFLSDHGADEGGAIVIALNQQARGISEIEADCVAIQPRAGMLLLFDGRFNPHYVRPLAGPRASRVSAVMNFYTESFPESTRPALLNRHLYGDGFRELESE